MGLFTQRTVKVDRGRGKVIVSVRNGIVLRLEHEDGPTAEIRLTGYAAERIANALHEAEHADWVKSTRDSYQRLGKRG